MEAAHTPALTSSSWKLIRSNPNVTVETMEIEKESSNGKISKYTKISAIFPDKPEKLMKAFHDFKTFDKQTGNSKDARDYFPFFNTAEFVLKSSSGATVMELVRYIYVYLMIIIHIVSCYSSFIFVLSLSYLFACIISFVFFFLWYGRQRRDG